MSRLHLLATNVLPAIFDFGVGALIAVGVLSYFQLATPWTWVIGGTLALTPDLDLIPSILRNQSTPFDHHQTLFHRPVLIVTSVSLSGWLLGGVPWAFVGGLCVVFHFLHDTGWTTDKTGIAWFWPFSQQFVSWYGLYEQQRHIDHHSWLRAYWTQPTSLSVIEIVLGLTALMAALYIQGAGWPQTGLIPAAGILLVGLVWSSKHRFGDW